MQAFIIIPCRNERDGILATCRSLGFAADLAPPAEAQLIVVDNGSTDGTLEILRGLAAALPAAVQIFVEAEPGYVPPRRRGCVEARRLAHAAGLDESQVLVLQADADTDYQPGYVAAMLAAAQAQTGPCMLEGVSEGDEDFKAAHPDFMRAIETADAPLAELFVDYEADIVIDDKVAGYRLGDYFAWGGQVREYITGGELHAETSRLLIRARLLGGDLAPRRVPVENAVARHSTRRTDGDPVMEFALAGFPQTDSWRAAWRARFPEPDTFASFADPGDARLREAIFQRQAHELILFALIPAAVADLCGNRVALSPALLPLLDSFDGITRHEALCSTSVLFDRAFALLQDQPGLFRDAITAV